MPQSLKSRREQVKEIDEHMIQCTANIALQCCFHW